MKVSWMTLDALDLKNDARRISCIKESPCFSCPVSLLCDTQLEKNSALIDIKYCVFGDKSYDIKTCPIYISLTAPEMVEEEV